MGTVAQDLLESMQFMVDHMEGNAEGKTHVVQVADDVDVKEIRQSLHMTQEAFAEAFHLEIAAVRAWEQKRRRPERAARLYLKVIAKNPQAVRDAIAA
ncbi:XRE family transcriptional regulator [Candidatus Terasakiella magnetica]|nr:XRE family transcriptional regulator [Candidatus Terasakiella magnetica]